MNAVAGQLTNISPLDTSADSANTAHAQLQECREQGYPMRLVIALSRSLFQQRQRAALHEFHQQIPEKRKADAWYVIPFCALTELNHSYDDQAQLFIVATLQAATGVNSKAFLRECADFGLVDTRLWLDLLYGLCLQSQMAPAELLQPDLRTHATVLDALFWYSRVRTSTALELKSDKPALEKFIRAHIDSTIPVMQSLIVETRNAFAERLHDGALETLFIDRMLAQGQPEKALELIAQATTKSLKLRQVGERKARARMALNDPFGGLLDLLGDMIPDAQAAFARPGSRQLLTRLLLGVSDNLETTEPTQALDWYRQLRKVMPEAEAPLRHELRSLKLLARYSEALPLARELLRRDPADHMRAREFGVLLRLCNRPLVDKLLHRYRRKFSRGQAPAAKFALVLFAFERQRELIDLVATQVELLQDNAIGCLYQLSLQQSGHFAQLIALKKDSAAAWHLGNAGEQALAAYERLCKALSVAVTTDTDTLLAELVARFRDVPTQYESVPGRVLVVTHTLGIGGCERQIQYLLSGGAEQTRHEFRVLVKQRRLRDFDVRDASVNWLDDMPARTTALMQSLGLQPDDLAKIFRCDALETLIGALFELRPEIVHFTVGNVVETTLASLFCGVPRTLIQFGSMHLARLSGGGQTGDFVLQNVDTLGRLLYGSPRFQYAVNSNAAVADWTAQWQVEPGQFALISNAFDQEHIGHGDVSAEQQAFLQRMDAIHAQGGKIVGSVFRFDEVKDPWFWFAVARSLVNGNPRFHVVHVGDGPAKPLIERLVHRFGLENRIIFAGVVTQGLAQYYQRFDVSIMTSHTECLPNVVLEAQSCGVPVVTPDVGGIHEGVVVANATLVPEKTVPAFRKAIVAWLNAEPMDAEAKSSMQSDILARFTVAQMINQTLSCYGSEAFNQAGKLN